MALPRRAQRLWAYWRAEQRTLRQGLVALALSTLAGFVAGLTLAHITGTLEELPGLIVLIPAAVGMKGTIFGAIGARLGTANVAGLLEPTLRPGGVLQRNVYVAVVTTFSSALWLAVLSVLASAAFGEPSISLWRLATISIVGGAIGSALILMITLTLSVLSYRRGWDLDSVSTPMVTALGDMTTLPSLFLATYLLRWDLVAVPAAVISIAVAVYAAIRSYTVADRVIRRIVVEMTAVILLTPILDILAGSLLRARQEELVAVPVLLALIPPFVSQAGALGGIFTSRTASKLQIGVITARGLPEYPALVDASIVSALSIAVFAMVGAVAYVLGAATDLVGMPSFPTLVAGTFLAGLIVTPITLVAGYYLAIGTFRFGLDPDDQSVPIITSLMDLAGVAVVLFVMTSLGVLPNG
ncbi:MAG TPA: magnesium transporter [Actinomycetota bacterium]|jgi:mgtE-like transporter|nr:magnesium transporter [Actinomycetota bacterium]